MTEREPRTADAVPILFSPERSDDVRFALVLTYITIGWMTIEAFASLLLGWVSKSLLLEAFGIDSVVELFSAGVLLWRLKGDASVRAGVSWVVGVGRRCSCWVGFLRFLLLLGLGFCSLYGL